MEQHRKVRFKGEEYWLHDDMLSPLDHWDEAGNLLANPFRDISFATITEDGKIMRYLCIIGTVDDIEEVAKPSDPQAVQGVVGQVTVKPW